MQLKNGNVLLALGYDNEENRHIRWLFRLEKISDINGETADINAADIRWDAADDVPQPVRDYAVDYVREQIEYYNSLGYNITDAKITAMTRMNTGTAALTKGIEMWLLEYRLLPENANKVLLAGGMRMEDGWLTEWGSTGQPYLLLVWDDTETERSWQRICITNTDVIKHDYGTPEMLERYGNEFTAAAMELYKKNLFALDLIETSETKGETKRYVYHNLEIELTNVKSDRTETMIDDGGSEWKYTVITCYPGAKLTIINADMSDPAYSADGKAHPNWGIMIDPYNPANRINITDGMQPLELTPDIRGIYNLESSLYVFRFET
jgi:hypothetical protein